MKIVNIAQRTPEWLAWRKQGITGTDAAALLGLNEHKTPWRIWGEKLDKVPPEDISNNPHVKRGVALEPIARDAVEEKYGIMLLPLCGEYDDYPIIRASFDGIPEDGRPHEIKCPCDSVWEDLQANGEKSEHFIRYKPQCQVQLLVAGAKSMLLIYYHKGELLEFTIYRDEVMIQDIITAVQEFWPLVEKQKEPEKDPLRDIFVPDGKTRSDWMTQAKERIRITALLEKAEKRVANLKEELKPVNDGLVVLMGEFLRAECDGVSVTRYSQQGNVNWKKLIEEQFPDFELTDDVMAKYRGKSSMRTRISNVETEETEQKVAKKRAATKKPAKPVKMGDQGSTSPHVW